MLAARGQAEQYAKALPVSEGWPPFLLVVDVGFSKAPPTAVRARRLPWPAGLSDQVQLVKDSLRSNQMLGVDEVASRFIRARRTRVQEILETLTALGQIRRVNDRYVI